MRERTIEPLFAHRVAAATPSASVQPEEASGTIEQVLDAYAAHTLTRNGAAARIRDLTPARSRIPSVTTM